MKIADFLQAFTFYYIYIKTFKVQGYVILSSQFTFYYIYIKTQPIFQLLIHILHLHSIIFILKLSLHPISNICIYYLHSIIFILKLTK